MPIDLHDWLDEHWGSKSTWFAKRLSGNDTLANGSHQVGLYVPKDPLFRVFPQLNSPNAENPSLLLDARVDSHADSREVRAVWYNNRLRGRTRDEIRITRWGGAQSALLDPDSTGALCVLVFKHGGSGVTTRCHVWVCRDEIEEDVVENRVGPVEPGKWVVRSSLGDVLPGILDAGTAGRRDCWLRPDEVPPEWIQRFPAPIEIIGKVAELQPAVGLDVDGRLVRRRECEYGVFRSIEEAIVLPRVRRGFETMDEFTSLAQTVLQRRKARSGLSLELHTRAIFREENLAEDEEFSYNKEPGHRPDFLFPSVGAYRDPSFPGNRLRMLAVKTSCKDRWRQILNEAARIERKHLLTLQEGVSETQFREMTEARVQLVVPGPLARKYPNSVQPHLQTLESFIADIRLLCV